MELAQEDVVKFANALYEFSDSPKDMLRDCVRSPKENIPKLTFRGIVVLYGALRYEYGYSHGSKELLSPSKVTYRMLAMIRLCEEELEKELPRSEQT